NCCFTNPPLFSFDGARKSIASLAVLFCFSIPLSNGILRAHCQDDYGMSEGNHRRVTTVILARVVFSEMKGKREGSDHIEKIVSFP
ncbi:hypothetical protein, partial [Heliomicrobium gestii]|uniref:hypothetical protein n=1 Tax=Heliomicrobium gestii TaxID=2699 RepID=UPI001A9AC074